jgi:hypothetical protein
MTSSYLHRYGSGRPLACMIDAIEEAIDQGEEWLAFRCGRAFNIVTLAVFLLAII